MKSVQIVFEGTLDGAVASRLLNECGLMVEEAHRKGGRSKIEAKVRGYHAASKMAPWFVLADLDDYACAEALLTDWGIPNADKMFVCRFAVREVESWLLADPANLSKTLAVSRDLFPYDPDDLADPKHTLVEIAKRSRKREIREDIVPDPRSLREEGPGYNLLLTNFVTNHWEPGLGAQRSRSLARCLEALAHLSSRLKS